MIDLIQAIAVTAELTGAKLSEAAAMTLAEDLAEFPEHQVIAALKRCRRELRTRLTVAEVIARIDDGRPGPQEAWAMIPRDEDVSVVWTDEMRLASGAASDLMAEGDMVAARMTFIEVYTRLLAEARDKRVPPRWTASLGFSKAGREPALQAAIDRGALTLEQARQYLPMLSYGPSEQRAPLLLADDGAAA